MAPAVDHLRLENRIAVVREYAALWQQFFTYFSEDISERNFTAQEEQDFANMVSILAVNQYKFQELCGAYYKDAGKVMDVLTETVSLDHMKHMADSTFGKVQIEWHTLFIGMNKALGKMLSELPPKRLLEMQQGTAAPAR